MEMVWLIIPVHNRREVTRACLLHLAALGLPEDFVICVVDDGCTDGTSEMLAAESPWVRVVRGDGNLYWGRHCSRDEGGAQGRSGDSSLAQRRLPPLGRKP